MRPFTDEELAPVIAAYREHGSQDKAAAALGVSRDVVRNRLNHATLRGLLLDTKPAMPGYRISQVTTNPSGGQSIQQRPEHGEKFEMPAGLDLMGVSAYVDPDERLVGKWVMGRKGKQLAELELIEHIKTAFAEYEGRAEPIQAPAVSDSVLLNLIPCNDFHVNLLTWRNEVGENWDLKIAERVIGAAIDEAISESPRAAVGVVLGGGDLMHNDDNSNRTAKSGNLLEADGRHSKGLQVAERLKVRIIDAALRHHGRVVVRILKGNHDENSATTIAHFLSAWYRNEPRVTVDLDESLFWYWQHGDVMLAATHGHTVKLDSLPMIMAHRQAAMWGATKFRYGHGFHIHHRSKVATEGNGVICESHQAPIPQDSWHYGSGYLSGRSVQTIAYHKRRGEHSRKIVGISANMNQKVAA